MGFGGEDFIKELLDAFRLGRIGIHLIGFQISIEPPELAPYFLQILSALLTDGSDLVDAPFGVDPTERMQKHIELASIIADDNQVPRYAMFYDATVNLF